MSVPTPTTPSIVCSGASVGLPGGEEVFGWDNVARVLAGESRLGSLGPGSFDVLGSDPAADEVKAGVRAAFDLTDYGLPLEVLEGMDITSQLAMAAGIEALRDAGLPLVRRREGAGWGLPEPLRDRTGVLFASAFPGSEELVEGLASQADAETDPGLVFRVLAMGHVHFAWLLGARGPNTHVNAACASTALAVCIAEDWIRAGRCDRVVVIAADDLTGGQLLASVGRGLLAAAGEGGEDGTGLHRGMAIGMGAVGLVLEKAEDCAERGVVPIAELVGSLAANSAFHESRIDTAHLASCVRDVVEQAARREGVALSEMASDALFVPQGTHALPRGEVSAVERAALRAAFGEGVSEVPVASTVDSTGHAMGAGIDDAVVLKALQYGRVPPVVDAEASTPAGGAHGDFQYGIRLAAGFGSQIVALVWKRIAFGDARVPEPRRRAAWLKQVTGYPHVDEIFEKRTLRVTESATDGLLPLPSAFPPDDVTTQETPLPSELRMGTPSRETLAPAPSRADSEPASSERRAPTPVTIGQADMLADLLAVVALETGYPITDLGPQLALEADLGLDEGRQAEIVATLRDRYGLGPTPLPQVTTVGDLARFLELYRVAALRRGPRADDDDTITLVPDRWSMDTDPSPSGWTPVPDERFGIPPEEVDEAEPTWTPAPERHRQPSPDRTGWTWEPVPLPPSFAVRRPVLSERPARYPEVPRGIRVRVVGAGAAAEAIRRELVRRGAVLRGPPDVVIDAGVDVLDSLRLARKLDTSRPRRWLAVTRLGGLGGEAPSARAFADGARAGFSKALGREWEETLARVVDVPPGEPDDQVAATVCEELLCDDGIEVFRRYHQRLVVQYRLEPTPMPGPLWGDPVVVITGGARGICARVAREIARRGPARLALVGRTTMPEEVVDLAEARERIKSELKSSHRRVTPAMVEERLAPLRRANEARQTLDALEAMGTDALYYTADLSDPRAVPELLARVQADLGELDIVIHGAGHDESGVIAEKDNNAFRRVFDAKARGGRALFEALPVTAFLVSMGSVIGRFGNAGQADYAAANEAMARLCLANPNALHVAWTPWDDVGMAVRGGMRRWLENRGVDLLPADAGASLLVDLIAARVTGEVMVAGRLGELLPAPSHPLLDRWELEGDVVRGYRKLSLASDPWLADYVIDDTPVLPEAVGVELMIALASRASPGLPPVGVRNLVFGAPVKLHPKQEVTAVVEARPIDDFEVRCTLTTERVLRTGRVQRTAHFEAVVILGELMQPDHLPSAFFPDEPVPAETIYGRFFHGPSFRVLEGATGVAIDGLIATARVNGGGIAPHLHTRPLVLEAALQAAALHRLVEHHQTSFPASLDEVRFLRPPPPDGLLHLMVHHDGVAYGVDVDGAQGAVARVRGLSLVERETLAEPLRIPAPPGGRPRCFPDRAANVMRTTPVAVSRRVDDATARAFWNEEQPEEWLTPEELAALEVSGGSESDERDQIAGHIAAKRALSRLTGVRPHTIRIHHAESGEPMAEVPNHPEVRVSIAHREGLAVAMAVSRGRVGIDLGHIEPRSPDLSGDWFDPSEQSLVGDDPVRQTLVWCIKEAVLKALGAGLALPPRDVLVRTLGEGGANVELRGTAADAHQEVGGGRLIVKWRRDGESFLVATARLAG